LNLDIIVSSLWCMERLPIKVGVYPLTFIVGIYGMNFKFMPELGWRWSYLIVWAIIVVIVVSMVIYFKKKKWL